MNEKLPNFLRRVKDSIEFNLDGEFYFYIPEKFFDLKIAYYSGEHISTLGIMNYAMKVNGKLSGLNTFNYPTRFFTKPYKVDKIKDIRLTESSEVMDYRVLTYKKGDQLIVDIKVPQLIDNAEQLIQLFIINGVIPSTIPYDKIQEYFINNYAYNGNKYNISLQLFGILISELCRSKKDIKLPFRLSKDSNMNNYKSISVKTVPRFVSAYTAFSSENINEALVYASLNDNKVDTPLEKVLTGEDV